jgi:integrase
MDMKTFQFVTMMFVCHDACLRLKELLALKWSDIEFIRFGGNLQAMRIRIHVSKARHTEAPEFLTIPGYFNASGESMCGLTFLAAYMQDAAVLVRRGASMDSLLFPNVRTGQGAQPRETFVSFVRKRLAACGILNPQDYGGHSFRAGGATDLFRGHAHEAVVKMLGRWRSHQAYLIYIRLDPSQSSELIAQAFSTAYQMGVVALEDVDPETVLRLSNDEDDTD